MDTRDTIVAPATPVGEGGVGIIRLSGSCAVQYLEQVFHPASGRFPLLSHRLYYGHLRDPDGELVDEVLAVVMRQPGSYTKEDVVEVHCHGGSLVLRRVLDLFIDLGARLARPGEFTLRAFLNGRIDLTRAEAVLEVIRARSEAFSRIALQQLEGRLSRVIYRFRDRMADQLALIEAYVDFPEEDLELPHRESLLSAAAELSSEIDQLLSTFDTGRVLREGLSVLILGRPNVGKSSLLNALLGEARVIVTEIPGTTRDLIEESLTLGGVPLKIVDTAGIRSTLDPVESEGVRRARGKVAQADLVLLVIDGSQPVEPDDFLALEACAETRVLIVVNKGDLGALPLPSPFDMMPAVSVSALTGEGLDALRDAVVKYGCGGDSGGESRESVLLSDRRHREALVRCRESLERFRLGLEEETSPEFLAFELREGLAALGEITGETTPEDVLERIFTRFCIGK